MLELIAPIQTDVGSIYFDDEGFCRIDLDSSQIDTLDVKRALQLCNAICEIADNKPVKIITDVRNVRGFVEVKARKVIRDHPGYKAVRAAEAFVVDALANRLLANFYMKFDRPPNPTKVFGDIEAAKEWLRKVNA